jgi:hypothetical protein
MVTSLAVEPVSPGTTNLMDFRSRPAMGERAMLADSTRNSSAGSKPDDRDRDSERHSEAAEPAEPIRDRTASFAAAVIAGALSPTPQSMEELIRRIGSSEIPVESQARLKDLLA